MVPRLVLVGILAFLTSVAPLVAQTPGVQEPEVSEEAPIAVPDRPPPDPNTLPAPPPAGGMLDALASRVPYHGNYCGRGNRGGDPIDVLDTACKAHDDCYDGTGDGACACDRALRADTLRIANDRTQPPELRRRAAVVAQAMEVKPCER